MTVGIVVVSHSEQLARGVVELCAQMAPDVTITAAGGADEGGLGTSMDRTRAGIGEADSGDGVVILADLGSAEMTAQMALDFLEPELADRVLLADAPIVEGALAAATAAGGGADLAGVLAAAQEVGGGQPTAAAGGTAGAGGSPAGGDAGDAAPAEAEATVTLPNPLGLHARPAAEVVAALRDLDAEVTIRNAGTGASAPATSLLRLAALEAAGGAEIGISARGPDAADAVARIERMARAGFGEPAGAPPTPRAGGRRVPAVATPVEAGTTLRGVTGAPGLALGRAARPAEPPLEPPAGAAPDAEAFEAEWRSLEAARDRARAELEALAARPEGGIFAAHRAILDDPALTEALAKRRARGVRAAEAWQRAVGEQESILASATTEAFAARAADVRDVGRRVVRALRGAARSGPEVPRGAVAVAPDLVPSDVPALAEAGAAALVLGGGGATAHVAVLARNLGLPLVVGLGPAVEAIEDGTLLLVDAGDATVVVSPDEARQAEAREAIRTAALARRQARAAAAEPGRTADGTGVTVAANASSVAEAKAAVANGAEGIGLLRTEFLFTGRERLPDEDEQVESLSAICAAMEGRPVIVRTLDVGGDKNVPGLDLDPVRNGFLGVRGLRLSLAHPDLFQLQLRALLRVAAAHPVSVMFPMVTTAQEVRQARSALDRARASLDAERVPSGGAEEVGIMVEVPAAALNAASLAGEVDFFSVGTNDLAAYTMAADRTLPEVASLYRPDDPAVLGLVERLCEAARARGRWVGVCGELAGDPEAASELVRLGVRELSMAPAAIPDVKARLRAVDLGA